MASRRRSSFHGRWRCSEADDIAADGEMGARPCVKSRVRTRELGLYGTETLQDIESSSRRYKSQDKVHVCSSRSSVRPSAMPHASRRPEKAAALELPSKELLPLSPAALVPLREPSRSAAKWAKKRRAREGGIATIRQRKWPSAAVVAANHLAKAAQQELAVRAETREGGRKGTGSVGSVSEDKFERPRLPSKHDLRNSRAHAWRA